MFCSLCQAINSARQEFLCSRRAFDVICRRFCRFMRGRQQHTKGTNIPQAADIIGASVFIRQSVGRMERLSLIKRLNSNSVRSRTADFTKGTHLKPRAVSFTAQCALLRSAPISQRHAPAGSPHPRRKIQPGMSFHAPAGLLLLYSVVFAASCAADSNTPKVRTSRRPPIHRRVGVHPSVCGAEGAASGGSLRKTVRASDTYIKAHIDVPPIAVRHCGISARRPLRPRILPARQAPPHGR